MMPKVFGKVICWQCHRSVQESSKSICCSSSYVWHHFKCSGLYDNEFENHLHNKSIAQNCQKCFYFSVVSALKEYLIIKVQCNVTSAKN